MAEDQKDKRYVTWAALLSILGAFFGFILLLLVEAFNEIEQDAANTTDRFSDSILHIDSETRKDLRDVRDDLEDHILDGERHYKDISDDDLQPPVIEYPSPELDPANQ